MKYRPYWQRILFLAAVFNLILFLGGASIFSAPKLQQTSQEDLIEVEWVEETAETLSLEPAPEISAAETFSEIILPPLEIQHTIFEPLPKFEVEPIKPNVKPQPAEKPAEVEKPPVEKIEEKPAKPEDKLKAIVKVYPKDIIPQIMQSGVIRTPLKLPEEKVVLSVTITVEGKVRDVKIISGGGDDLINFISISSAGGWIFEPYLDADGNPQELKTQIEFTAEDFQI